ncbi:Glutathione S-transferase [Rhizobiales bacterium GAS191]|nr:Glutathione S-transferase [Rhizobiales bacterium GAS188]SED51059.1 Glutathione S-transferase [Rhizobiales bacterium GAS191]
MSLTLYELGGLEDRRYSLFSWRARLALAHKKLEPELVPVRVSDKAPIAFSGQDKVPILRDGEAVIVDSWRIAEHLDDRYPDPPLFDGPSARALSRFVAGFVDRQLVPRLVPLLMIDVMGIVDAEDGTHLRRQIEAAFKRTLEELSAGRDKEILSFRRLLDPVRVTLAKHEFLSGAAPGYADYALFSLFQWARIVSAYEVLDGSDPVSAWRERMLGLHGGSARSAPARIGSPGPA